MAAKWLVLDALGDGNHGREALREAVRREAAASGADCRFVAIPRDGLASCKGCFACWTKTPGLCRQGGDALGLGRAWVVSETVILLTRVVLGGYAPELRLAMERAVLPSLLPYFSKVNGRSRHGLRYPHPPALFGLGWTSRHAPEVEQLFSGLVARNAANMGSPRHGAGVAAGDDEPENLQRLVQDVLGAGQALDTRPLSVVVLTGSPKPRQSTSAALGEHVAGWLAARGAVVQTFSLTTAREDEEAFAALAEAVGEADGVCLTFPVYADQIPGAAAEALARLAGWRAEIPSGKGQGLFAVANCGFPEPANCDAALAMGRLFAREAGFAWLGGVGVGGGGMYEGRPLSSFGFMSAAVRRALETKAALLLSPTPPDLAETGDILVPCPLPDRVYQWLADRGWQKALRGKDGIRDALARPYAVPGTPSS